MALGEALARCPELELVPGRSARCGRGMGEGRVGSGGHRRGGGAGPRGARLFRRGRAAGAARLGYSHDLSRAPRARPTGEDRGGPDTLLRAGRGAWRQRAPRQGRDKRKRRRAISPPDRWTCSAFARTRLPWWSHSSVSACARLESCASLDAMRWPIASVSRAHSLIVWPMARTARSCRGEWRSRWRSLWRSGTPAVGRCWNACSGCSSIACSRVQSVAAGPCGRLCSQRGSWAAGPGASGSCSARRSATQSAWASLCRCACRCCRRPPSRCASAWSASAPREADQRSLLEQDEQARRGRLGEAVNQVRTVAGHDAALRAVCIDPDSRVPERRVVLTPLPG